VLCDEHVPGAVANALRSEGIDVARVGEQVDPGTADEALLEFAAERGYVVLTSDSDFADVTGHAGVLYDDDQRVPNRELVRAVRNVSELLDADDLTDRTVFVPDGWV
jgi:hypothetical protein